MSVFFYIPNDLLNLTFILAITVTAAVLSIVSIIVVQLDNYVNVLFYCYAKLWFHVTVTYIDCQSVMHEEFFVIYVHM